MRLFINAMKPSGLVREVIDFDSPFIIGEPASLTLSPAAVSSWGHRRICSKSYFKRLRETRSAAFAWPNLLFEWFGRPDVVAVEADVIPAERSDVGEQLVGQGCAFAKFGRTASIGIVPRSRSVTGSRGGMSPTKPGSDAQRSIATSKHRIMPGPLAYDLEQILR
jgi:hypothetical protein